MDSVQGRSSSEGKLAKFKRWNENSAW